MIKVKLERDKSKKILFKLKIQESDMNILFKRAIMESKKLKEGSRYDYEVPLRFFFLYIKIMIKKKSK